ncbi:MAG: hypothetical protein L6U99_00360 [Clostridium sp.]|nr:MAG: hypothetical protein L6U99_00360 [Clostridium sp.]
MDENAPVGADPLQYLGLDDYCIDLNVTANRSDLLSIEGVCYDLAAALHQKNITRLSLKRFLIAELMMLKLM